MSGARLRGGLLPPSGSSAVLGWHPSSFVPLIVALSVKPAARGGTTREIIVNLPERPVPGENVELPDGTRITVETVRPSSRDGIDAEVSATRYS